MTGIKCLLIAASWLPALVAAEPTEESLLETLRQQHPATSFSAVRPTPIPGLFEVWMRDNVAYVAATAPRYFLFGRLFDSQELRELTGPSPVAGEAPLVDLSQLPTADALTEQRGQGQHQLVVFSDPACPYCQALERELATLDDLSVRTYLLPFLDEALARAIWCAADPLQAWQRWMRNADERDLNRDAQCDTPLQRNLALAERLGISSTPTLIWADGRRSVGALDAEQMEARLQEVTP